MAQDHFLLCACRSEIYDGKEIMRCEILLHYRKFGCHILIIFLAKKKTAGGSLY
jgi:hypothetical protein